MENNLEEIFEDATASNVINNSINNPVINPAINPTQNNFPNFDPSKFLGKITYELSTKNIITWQLFVRGILRFYGLEEWVLKDHTPKVRVDNKMEIDGSEHLKVIGEFNTYFDKNVTKEDVIIDGNVQFIIRSTLSCQGGGSKRQVSANTRER